MRQFGTPRSLDSIQLSDVLEHPIWVWAWEAGCESEAEDETWQCPVLGETNVTADFIEPVITARVRGSELYGSGSYNAELDQLEAISVWLDNGWVGLESARLPMPVELVALPLINGLTGARFICQEQGSDSAQRAA